MGWASALSLPVHLMTHALMVMSFLNRRSLREETRAAVGGTGEAWSSTAEHPDAALFAQTPGEGLPVRGAQRPRHSHPRANFWPSADQGPCERVSVLFRFFDFYWLETNSGNVLVKICTCANYLHFYVFDLQVRRRWGVSCGCSWETSFGENLGTRADSSRWVICHFCYWIFCIIFI